MNFIKILRLNSYVLKFIEKGVVMIFDLDDRESFTNIARWEKDMKKFDVEKSVFVTLVGNKSDLKTKV